VSALPPTESVYLCSVQISPAGGSRGRTTLLYKGMMITNAIRKARPRPTISKTASIESDILSLGDVGSRDEEERIRMRE
jgi:hypothetical protein